MSRTQRAILIALAIGAAAYKASGECPAEDFEGFGVGAVATNLVPGVTITCVPGSCPGGVDAVIVELGEDTSSPIKAVSVGQGCPTLSPDFLRLWFDEPQTSVSFMIGVQDPFTGVDMEVRGYSEPDVLIWQRTFVCGDGTRTFVELVPSGSPVTIVEVESVIPLFETIDDLRFAGSSSPPIVEIDEPLLGTCENAFVAVSGVVDDPDDDYQCDVLEYRPVDAVASEPWIEVSHGCGPSSGFLHDWDPSSVPDGLYYLRLTGSDWCGQATSDTTVVRIDRAQPTVSLAAPTPGSIVCGEVSVLGTVEDPCLEEIRLEYSGPGIPDWVTISTRTEQVFDDGLIGVWDTTGLPDGNYSLHLRAEDGHYATDRIYPITVSAGCGCLSDLDGSGHVGFNDLTILLGNWGACPAP